MQRYIEKITSDVQITTGITYAILPGYDKKHTPTTLCMDIYEPANDTETGRRALIFVHGGGFTGGTRDTGYPHVMCDVLAKYGYVCFTIDYRLFPDDIRPPYPDCAAITAQDIETARQYILSRAEEFAIDPNNISVAGGSAGAMAAVDACRIYPAYKAFVSLWGTYEGAQVPEKYPPTFLIHGTADQSIPYAYCTAFYARLQERGIPCELFTLKDASHTAIHCLPDYEEPMIRFMNSVM